jgi:hypothetical protein
MDSTPETWDAEDPTTLPPALAGAVLGLLAPGERVVWCAQPRMAALVRANVGFFLLVWLFGMVGPTPVLVKGYLDLSMAIDFRILQYQAMRMVPMMVLPVPTLLLLAWALLRTRRRARSTAYVVTNRRAMIVSTRPTWKVAAYAAADLASPRIGYRGGGSADIVLGTDGSAKANGPSWNTMYGVQDADRVMRLIRELASAASEGGTGAG